MNDLNDLVEGYQQDKTNCFGISVAIGGIDRIKDIRECYYLPDGVRKVIVWEDGKEYEIVIKPLK